MSTVSNVLSGCRFGGRLRAMPVTGNIPRFPPQPPGGAESKERR